MKRLLSGALVVFIAFPCQILAQDIRQAGADTRPTITGSEDSAAARAFTDAASHARRISELDDAGPALNAVIAANGDASSQAWAQGDRDTILQGRTVLVKDNIETREWPTTAGSLALENNLTGRDASLITRLRDNGGVVLGKTNLSEWANIRSGNSSSGWSAIGGQTRNPHATDRNTCGSSSGSGAAVAAGFAWAAIGTETDGSITCPASVNGVVGFKPSVGLVSRTHIVPISVSQDTAGPMANSVSDAALLLSAIAGSDMLDPATAAADSHAGDFTEGLATASLDGVRIGVMRNQAGAEGSKVRALFETALGDLRAAGAELVDISFDPDPAMYNDEFIVLLYEFRTGLDAYLQSSPAAIAVRSLADVVAFNRDHADTEMRWFGQDTFELALTATDPEIYQTSRANALRLAGPEGIDRLLAEHQVTVLIAPTAGPAWVIDLVLGDNFGDPAIGAAGSLAAIAGYPHLSVPMGDVEGLPVGLSFIGAKWSDHAVLQAGAAYERARTVELAEPDFTPWTAP